MNEKYNHLKYLVYNLFNIFYQEQIIYLLLDENFKNN